MERTNKRYRVTLTRTQINNIYNVTTDREKQKRIMSILAYMTKYTDMETLELNVTRNKLYEMYGVNNWKNHEKISKSYFYKITDLVRENNYFLEKPEKISEEISEETKEIAVSVENTNVEETSIKTNNLTNNNTNTYTLYTSSEDVKNNVKAMDLLDEIFKDLKIKSKVIKTMVIAKLQNTVLDCKGAVSYIMKVITEKMEQYNTMKVNYAKKVAETKYSKAKSGFIGKKSNVVCSGVVATGFNNFKAREYDYEDLERKLLGWN